MKECNKEYQALGSNLVESRQWLPIDIVAKIVFPTWNAEILFNNMLKNGFIKPEGDLIPEFKEMLRANEYGDVVEVYSSCLPYMINVFNQQRQKDTKEFYNFLSPKKSVSEENVIKSFGKLEEHIWLDCQEIGKIIGIPLKYEDVFKIIGKDLEIIGGKDIFYNGVISEKYKGLFEFTCSTENIDKIHVFTFKASLKGVNLILDDLLRLKVEFEELNKNATYVD